MTIRVNLMYRCPPVLRVTFMYMGSSLCTKDPYTTRSKKFSPKNRKDLGMACHTLPLKKVKKQGEMPLPSLSPIPLKNVEFRDGMGPRLGNCISPCFFTFLRGGVWQAIPKSFLFSGENFLLLVCEVFRAHEMRSQLEVTDVNLIV